MNSKKILQQALKSVPDKYVTDNSRIWLRNKQGVGLSRMAVLITHPQLSTIIWTKEDGWESLHEDEKI